MQIFLKLDPIFEQSNMWSQGEVELETFLGYTLAFNYLLRPCKFLYCECGGFYFVKNGHLVMNTLLYFLDWTLLLLQSHFNTFWFIKKRVGNVSELLSEWMEPCVKQLT